MIKGWLRTMREGEGEEMGVSLGWQGWDDRWCWRCTCLRDRWMNGINWVERWRKGWKEDFNAHQNDSIHIYSLVVFSNN